MGVSCEDYELFPLGCLVVIKRGKHAGTKCAVVGRDADSSRVLIADGSVISTKRPKRKNPRHLQRTSRTLGEVEGRLARGQRIDDGWLIELIRSHGDLEEVGSFACPKTTSLK